MSSTYYKVCNQGGDVIQLIEKEESQIVAYSFNKTTGEVSIEPLETINCTQFSNPLVELTDLEFETLCDAWRVGQVHAETEDSLETPKEGAGDAQESEATNTPTDTVEPSTDAETGPSDASKLANTEEVYPKQE